MSKHCRSVNADAGVAARIAPASGTSSVPDARRWPGVHVVLIQLFNSVHPCIR